MQINIEIVDSTIRNNLGIELEREIGRGKYGVVYSGIIVNTNQNCAVKVISLPTEELEDKLRDIYGDDEEAIESAVREMAARFETEIRSMSRLGGLNIEGSRNIIRMYNHMLVQEGMYSHIIISMELALPLKRFLMREGENFTVEKVIDISLDVAKGLNACHSEGIIHRDIKEDNLFIGVDKCIKIGDFGVANISHDADSKKTEGVGTPHYMAPEIKNNEGYDKTVDIYSLGIVMYMILNNNKPPFFSNQIDERTAYDLRMSGRDLPFPAYAPNELGHIVLKCCQYNPRDRYQDVSELIEDLTEVKANLMPGELNAVVPYPKRQLRDVEWWDGKFDKTTSIFTAEVHTKRDILRDTVGAFRDLLQRFGNNTRDGQFIEGVYTGKGVAEREMNEAERRVKFMRRILITVICIVVVLLVTLVLLYPKTASFYPNSADGNRVYVKYLFLPEKRLSEHPASYVNTSGNEVFFSDRKDEKKLYKVNMWTGQETLLCDKEAHYDIVIGDYVYFTDGSPLGSLYRIRKDGSNLKCIVEGDCGELKNINGSLEVWFASLNEYRSMDVNSIHD